MVTLTNIGPNDEPAASVGDTLPPSVTLVSATPSQGSASVALGGVSASFGLLPAGATATLTIVVIPDNAGTITNTAAVIPQAGNLADPDLTNNSASDNVLVLTPSPVTIAIAANANPAPVATNFTYTLTVSNGGRVPVVNLQVLDQLPAIVSVVSFATSQGTATNGIGASPPSWAL